MAKWAEDFDEDLPFINYFRHTWIESDHFRWFEGNFQQLIRINSSCLGASIFPSTNNALEAHNKQIKDQHSLRERLPFNRFVTWAEKMVGIDWSTSRGTPNQVEPKIKPHLYVEARHLHNSNHQVFVVRANEQWAIPSTEHAGLNSRQVKQLARSINNPAIGSFEEFAENRFKVSF